MRLKWGKRTSVSSFTKTGSTPTPWETEIQTMVSDHGLEPLLERVFFPLKDRDWTSLSFWSGIWEFQGVRANPSS